MTSPAPADPHVRLHVWGVPNKAIPGAFARMGSHRLSLRRILRERWDGKCSEAQHGKAGEESGAHATGE